MPNHENQLGVAVALTAIVFVFIGVRLGRTSAAWRAVRSARSDVPVKRRIAWRQTRGATGGILVLVAVLAAVVADLVR
ncbi:MAG TPA: hypothetical protein VFO77_10920 [Actinoplanes sp.]|nr:hypothetical protein [Actinoplanes sp.]